jgi:hypothetical protein
VKILRTCIIGLFCVAAWAQQRNSDELQQIDPATGKPVAAQPAAPTPQQAQAPAAAPQQAEQEQPAQPTTGPVISAPPELPKYPDVRMPGESGWSFGGYVWARYWHFVAMSLLVILVVGHIFMVVTVDPYSIGSMVTGRYDERYAPAARDARPFYHLRPPKEGDHA